LDKTLLLEYPVTMAHCCSSLCAVILFVVLQAPYTDPLTKLRYATAEEYSRIRLLPTDIVSGLLTLRHANNPVQ